MRSGAIAIVLLLAACGTPQQPVATVSQRVAGPLADTWTWVDGVWRQVPATGPAARYGAAMAYDAARKDFILYGGLTTAGTSAETWSWDGARWKQRTPAHRPPPLRDAAMAFDPRTARVVLFGGHFPGAAEGNVSGQTWLWDGADWTMAADSSDQTREGARLVTAGDRVLMFGGHFWNTGYFADVYAWSGSSWSRIDRDPTPPGRGNAAVVWNPTAAALFVYGGTGLNAAAGPGNAGKPLADGWVFSAGTWSVLADGPPPLFYAGSLWERQKARALVLFGMACPSPSAAVWAWDGNHWSHDTGAGVPARWGAAVAQAPDGRALLFGGSNEKGC